MKKQMWFALTALVFLALACNLPVPSGEPAAQNNPAIQPTQAGQSGETAPSQNQGQAAPGEAQVIIVTATPEPTQIPSQPVAIQEGLNSLNSYTIVVAIKSNGPNSEELMEMTVETQYDAAADARLTHQVSRSASVEYPEIDESTTDTYNVGLVTCSVSEDSYDYEETTASQKEMSDLMSEMIDLTPIIANPQFVGTETLNGIPSNHFTFQISGIGAASGSQVLANQGEYWLAADGNYIVKYTLLLETLDAEGKISHLEARIEMVQINQPVTITMPEGCHPQEDGQ